MLEILLTGLGIVVVTLLLVGVQIVALVVSGVAPEDFMDYFGRPYSLENPYHFGLFNNIV